MKFDIHKYIVDKINGDEALRVRYGNLHRELILPARTTLLEAGETARDFYYIERGCVRLWFNQDGKDITLQFFFDGHGVASIESFIRNIPSVFSIETVVPTTVWTYNKADVLQLTEEIPALKEELSGLIVGNLLCMGAPEVVWAYVEKNFIFNTQADSVIDGADACGCRIRINSLAYLLFRRELNAEIFL